MVYQLKVKHSALRPKVRHGLAPDTNMRNESWTRVKQAQTVSVYLWEMSQLDC